MTYENRSSEHIESIDQRIRREAEASWGIVTTDQLLGLGLAHSQITTRLRNGFLRRIYMGVYSVAGVPPSWEQDLMAANRALGPTSAVSHRSAAFTWGLDGVSRKIVELSTPIRRRPPGNGAILHHTDPWRPRDLRWRGSLRVTGPERTILDLATVLGPSKLESALESAVRDRLTTIERIELHFHRRSGKGYKGSATLRRLLEERIVDFTPTDSEMEIAWERVVRQGRFPKAERQFKPIDADYIYGPLDFAWPAGTVGVETDSWKFHFGKSAWERDHRKANWYARHGWIVLRFTWKQITFDRSYVVDTIKDVLLPRLG